MTVNDIIRALVDGNGAVLNSPGFRVQAHAALDAADGNAPVPSAAQAKIAELEAELAALTGGGA